MTDQPYGFSEAAFEAAADIVGRWDAAEALLAAHDPLLGPDRSVNARTHRAEVIEEVIAWVSEAGFDESSDVADAIRWRFLGPTGIRAPEDG